MAQPQISELLKSLQQGNGGFTQPQSPFQLDAPAPAIPPAVGPTVAKAAALQQAPAPAGAMPELRDVFGNPMAMPSVPNVAPTPVDLVPSLSDPATRTRDLAGTGSGALIDTPSSGGFAGIEEGISEAVGAAPLGVATPAPSAPSPLADPNTGVSPTALGAPTSGSGIGTSVVNDVNFLQEGMKQMQAPQPQGLTTAGGQPLAEFLAGGQQLDPQGRMIDPNVDRSDFEKESAAREARMDQRTDFGTAVSDRDRRAARGEGMSDADRSDIAKANARGASASDIARGMKVADALGVDLKTGQPLASQGGLSESERIARERLEFDKGKFSYDIMKEEQGEVAAKAESQKRASMAASDAMRQNQNIMDTARDAGKNIGITTTGAGGALLGILPGTGAFDQKSTVDTLQADAAFTALQNMRDSSPTGGALGQVSERELKLLSSNVRNLDHKQSPEQFRKNLAEYVKLRNQSMANMYRAYATDFSAEEANAAFGVNGIEDFTNGEGRQGGIKNDRNVAGAADALLGKY